MEFIADFHIHSHYSVATSKDLTPPHLNYWAAMKGITVVGTGDFTHPGWITELKEHLEPAEPGLFALKKEYRPNQPNSALDTSFLPDREIRFLLTAEISSIYKKNGRVRKVHNVIFAPDFETVEKIQQKLKRIGANITSDGRPILGLDSRDLLEMALEANENIFFIPAHIWTPWFSVLGSKSGFDTVTECYDDLADHIHAVETGLSTDPPMNWTCRFLDKYTLISNSDAHSPEKLGRNANRFNTELSYPAIVNALKTGNKDRFLGSIDLFPQEGKYHYDGHRKCGICWNPLETLQHKGICPKCGKGVTVGVMNRVVQLSDRENPEERANRHGFISIIPLKELLAELTGVGVNSGKVDQVYMDLIKNGKPELELLIDTPIEEIAQMGGEILAEGIRRMRNREVYIREGYDGEFGVITVFDEKETFSPVSKNSLFKNIETALPGRVVPPPRKMINFDLSEYRRLALEAGAGLATNENPQVQSKSGAGLNPEQSDAVNHVEGPSLVIAGPGTGKTHVLVSRIGNLIENHGVEPGSILAVTFTNKAAAEIKERLEWDVTVTTFHAFGYSIIKENWEPIEDETQKTNGFSVLDPEDKKRVLRQVGDLSKARAAAVSNAIEKAKQLLKEPGELDDHELNELYTKYQTYLKDHLLVDLDDMLFIPVKLFEKSPGILEKYRSQCRWLLIDEYQDINYAQYRLIRLLMPDTASNICAIGDPDQAIYGFRGADVQYIKQFCDDYPGAAIYRLRQSYRCSDSILRASGNVIDRDNSSDSLAAVLKGIEKGVKIKIVKNATHKSEAEFVARTVEQMMGGLRFFSMDSDISEGHKEESIESLSDFVVLYRVKDEAEALEKAFKDHSIPYRVVGEEPFFKQEPVCLIIDALKWILNPKNVLLKEKLLEKGINVLPVMDQAGKAIEGNEPVHSVISRVIDQFFFHLNDESHDMNSKEALKELLNLAEVFGTDMEGFLKYVALGTGVDAYRKDLESVTFMTLHAAKGLEFKAVFIVGCEDGLIPYSLFKNQEAEREEERRLLYVGMTRSKKFLYLTHAEKRLVMGREYQLQRSPFLANIEKKLIELTEQERKKKEEGPTQRSLFDVFGS